MSWYIDGEEVTEEEMELQSELNNEILQSEDLEDWLLLKYIIGI